MGPPNDDEPARGTPPTAIDSPVSNSPTRRTQWVELDILRGLAGIIMVYNHAAARWLDEAQRQDPLCGALFLIGSYAPVVFFATTGIGYGIQSELPRKRAGHAFGFVRKVVILLVADALLWLGREIWIGLDFLGFIALSMLILEPIRRRRMGWVWPLVGVVVVAGLRYGLAPAVVPPPASGQPATLVHWLAGVASPPGFSYPILPWVGYTLAGFSVGVLMQRLPALIVARRRPLALALLGLGALDGAAIGWLTLQGAGLMRWGTVNKLFFVSGFVVLTLGSGLSLLAAPSTRLARLLSLRGISSLALVPLHYAVIAIVLAALDTRALSSAQFALMSTAAVVASLAMARGWDRVAKALVPRAWAWSALMVVTAAAIASKLLLTHALWLTLACALGQLALCCLLIVERRR